jgi:hypothetical protein
MFIWGGVNGYSPVALSFVTRILLVGAIGCNEEEHGTRTEVTSPFGRQAIEIKEWTRAGKWGFLVTADVRVPQKGER